VASLDHIDWAKLNGLFAQMEAGAIASLESLGVRAKDIVFERSADMRFAGQGFEIESALPAGALDGNRRPEIIETFLKAYRQLFDRAPEGLPVEGLSWRLRATGLKPKFSLDFKDNVAATTAARKGQRKVYFHRERAFLDCVVYDRYRLAPSTRLEGPAVIEERESTVVVGPGATVEIDHGLNVIVSLP
jgi:N-methylhydantoinase A